MFDPAIREKLHARLLQVEQRIAAACARTERDRSDVTLVAVTKTVGADLASYLPALGVGNLGENRPQELWRKVPLLPLDVRWHLIGHLQRNKIDRTLPLATLIHSVDSVRLLEALEAEAAKQGRAVHVLLEINASGEAQKHGFAPGDLAGLVAPLRALRHVRIDGLMTMAAMQEAEACRPTFALLRELRDWLRAEVGEAHTVRHLSMGMSNDFEVAIAEGATLVRLGSVLFEGVAP